LHEYQQWILSTHNKEDANDAFWIDNQSLAQLFESSNNGQIDPYNLDKNYIYMFVLCHPSNIIVVNHDQPQIYHVATYDRNTLREVDLDLGLPQPKRYNLSIQEIMNKTRETTDKPVKSAGYMIITENHGVHLRYRFENANYTRARQLRGSSNNINLTILELYTQKKENEIKEFFDYYPIYRAQFQWLLTQLEQLIIKLYTEYGIRYKKNCNIRVHPRHHKFLNEIHKSVYLGMLKPIGRTIQFDDINKFVINQPPTRILYLINYIYHKQT
jgi:hypothetical protein